MIRPTVICSCCCAPLEDMSTFWRKGLWGWEHKCPTNDPQAGYFSAVDIEVEKDTEVLRSTARGLARLLHESQRTVTE